MVASNVRVKEFQIGVSRLYPGEKLQDGDPRWGELTHSFYKETHTRESLATLIAVDGCAISAVMREGYRKEGNFVSAQHLALDCDQETYESSIEGLIEDPFIASHAAIVHETFSSTPGKPRSRVVFILDQPMTNAGRYREAAEALIWKFKGVDEHVKDPARLFFGRKNARYLVLGNILYNDILQEVIEQYLGARQSQGHHAAANPVADVIPKHYRNNTLTSFAGTMRWRGATEEEILAALLVMNQRRCRPPVPDEEIRGIARSISNYEPSSPLNAAQSGGEEEWPPLIKELPSIPAAPSLPAEYLPAPLRAWIQDIAERASIPLEFVAVPAVIAVSAVVGRAVAIQPRQYDDWRVVPNLWGGPVGRPGLMKTYAVGEALKPVAQLEAKARRRYEALEAEQDVKKDRLKAEIEAIKDDMVKAAKKSEDMGTHEKRLLDLKRQLKEATKSKGRYWTQDATVEKLGELLQQNPRGLLVARDELSGWLRTLDKPGREGDREFYLEAWNGDRDYTFDRIGRGTVYIPSMTVSLVGGIQPGKLRPYIEEALNERGGDDGLLQRLQLLIWPDGIGSWQKVDRKPNKDAKDRAFRIFETLDRLPLKGDGETIPTVSFTDQAQMLFDEWRHELENRLRSDELTATPAFESHLAKYRSLMPSLALLFHLIDVADAFVSFGSEQNGPSVEKFLDQVPAVSLQAARLAAAWCEFLEAHARKVYSAEIYRGVNGAKRLAEKIKRGEVKDGDAVRSIYRKGWEGLSVPSMVITALEELVRAAWIRMEQRPTGGRPEDVVRLHPDLRGING